MRAPGATATMSRDHVEVVRLAAELQRSRDSLHGATDAGLRHAISLKTSLEPSLQSST
jgi:hypothetical protein